MHRACAVVVLVLLSVIALGCGDGPDGRIDPSAPDDSAEAATKVELQQYLSRSAVALKYYRAGAAIQDTSMQQLAGRSAIPRSERRELSERFRSAAERYERAAVAQLRSRPPAALIAINRRYSALSTRIGAAMREAAVALKADDFVVQFNAVFSRQLPDADVRAEWRDAVTAYAADVGVAQPGWVRSIGTPRGED